MNETNEQQDPLKVTVYTPESEMRHPFQLLRIMLKDLWSARGLAWRLFVRDKSAMYRQSLLGYGWALLPPIVTTVTWTLLNRGNVIQVSATPVPYPAYVLCGTMLWQLFYQTLQCPLNSMIRARSMLTRINFAREAVVLAGLGEVLFHFSIQLLLLVPVFIWFGVPMGPTLLLAPIGALGLVVLGLAFGLLLAPLGMLYKDVGNTLAMMGTLWMLLTPVVYPPGQVGLTATLAVWNPVSPILVTARDWFISGSATYPGGFLIVTAIALVATVAGWFTMRLAMPILIERSGN